MSDPLLIYGAYGYTGELVVREALSRGLRPILSGRDGDRLAALSSALGLEARVAALDQPVSLDRALDGVAVVLHAAGPFSATASPMVDACLRCGVHYLDVSGEVDAIDWVRSRDREARASGLMLLPASGFDVVPSDCLAAYVANRLPGASQLSIGISGLDLATRGSLNTIAEFAGRPIATLRGGRRSSVEPGSLRHRFDFGDGPRDALAVGWGDVATAGFTTGIPDVTVYFESTGPLELMLGMGRSLGSWLQLPAAQAFLKAHTSMLPLGPTETQRAASRTAIVALAERADGRTFCARLGAPDAYTTTARASVELLGCVLEENFEPGFQTPARVYGPDFALRIDGVLRVDLVAADPVPEASRGLV